MSGIKTKLGSLALLFTMSAGVGGCATHNAHDKAMMAGRGAYTGVMLADPNDPDNGTWAATGAYIGSRAETVWDATTETVGNAASRLWEWAND